MSGSSFSFMKNLQCFFRGVMVFGAASVLVAAPATGSLPAAARALDSIPAWFEPNQGLHGGEVKYYSRGAGYTVSLEESGAVLSLVNETTPASLKIALVGGNPNPAVEGVDRLASRTDYFLGNQPSAWKRNVPHFARVRYRNSYPGIDMVYFGSGKRLEYDFVVSPGADPSRIRLRFGGADSVRLDQTGSLVIGVGGREVRQPRPVVYQDTIVGGERRRVNVEGRYILARNREVRFSLGSYDRRLPLVIDPVLVYAGYFGGTGYDVPTGIAVDRSGNVWLTGTTRSTIVPPQAQAPYQTTPPGATDVFVAELSIQQSGQASLLYWGYLGGANSDYGGPIAVDDAGNVYLAGSTYSDDFPVTANALQSTNTGLQDVFVAKLNPQADGKASLVYGTFFGGTDYDTATALTVDATGNIIVTGYTASKAIASIVPGTYLAYQQGGWDAFILKVNPAAAAGTAPLLATFYGGTSTDVANGVAVDASGAIYISGYTMSDNLPLAGNSYRSTYSGAGDLFVAKFDPTKSGLDMLVYASYLGGSKLNVSTGMALDAAGGVWLTGYTFSDDFPVTPNAYQTAFAGGQSDAFLVRLNLSAPPAGFLTYSTYFGGSGADVGYGLALAGSGKVAIAGYTFSDNLPLKDALPASQARSRVADAFLALLDTSKSGAAALVYSTYFGGTSTDVATRIVAGPSGALYVAGYTGSVNLPVTDGSQKANPPGGLTGFLLKLDTLSGGAPGDVPALSPGKQYPREVLTGLPRMVSGEETKTGRESRQP
jgi:hypothetical protein